MSYNQFFALKTKVESAHGIELDRKELISEFSNGQIDSLTGLSDNEFKKFMYWFKLKYDVSDDSTNQMRRKIIALFRKMGCEKGDKADMDRIYRWVQRHGYKKKPLNSYTAQELPKLVSQVERVYQSYIQAV